MNTTDCMEVKRITIADGNDAYVLRYALLKRYTVLLSHSYRLVENCLIYKAETGELFAFDAYKSVYRFCRDMGDYCVAGKRGYRPVHYGY